MAISTKSERLSLVGYGLPGRTFEPASSGLSLAEKAATLGLLSRSLIAIPVSDDRAAFIGLGLESIHVLPVPEGSFTVEDRLQLLNANRNIDTGGVSVTLSGVEGIFTAGDVGVLISITATITGVSSAGSIGPLQGIGGAVSIPASVLTTGAAGNIEVTTTGSSLWWNGSWYNSDTFNSDWWNLQAGVTGNITGIESTAGIGTLTVVGDSVVTLPGVQTNAELGGLSVTAGTSVSVGISGVSSVVSVGDFTVTGGSTITLTGVEATGEIGTIVAIDELRIDGVESIAGIGTLTIVTDAIVDIFGVSAQFQVGELTASEVIPPIIPDPVTWDEQDDSTGTWTNKPDNTGNWTIN